MFRKEIRVVKCLHLMISKNDRYCKLKKRKEKENVHGRFISIRNHGSNAKWNKGDKYTFLYQKWPSGKCL